MITDQQLQSLYAESSLPAAFAPLAGRPYQLVQRRFTATLTLEPNHSHRWAKSPAVMILLIGQARRRSEVGFGRSSNAGKVCIGFHLIACMIRWDGATHGLEGQSWVAWVAWVAWDCLIPALLYKSCIIAFLHYFLDRLFLANVRGRFWRL